MPTAPERTDSQETQRGGETVLLVEDQLEVRALARLALTRSGYRVLDAGSGEEAVAISGEFDGKIHLLLTDVMPGMNGRDLADRILTLREAIAVLFMSGYTENCITQRCVLHHEVSYLQKPFTPRVLVERVAAVLWASRTKVTRASDIANK